MSSTKRVPPSVAPSQAEQNPIQTNVNNEKPLVSMPFKEWTHEQVGGAMPNPNWDPILVKPAVDPEIVIHRPDIKPEMPPLHPGPPEIFKSDLNFAELRHNLVDIKNQEAEIISRLRAMDEFSVVPFVEPKPSSGNEEIAHRMIEELNHPQPGGFVGGAIGGLVAGLLKGEIAGGAQALVDEAAKRAQHEGANQEIKAAESTIGDAIKTALGQAGPTVEGKIEPHLMAGGALPPVDWEHNGVAGEIAPPDWDQVKVAGMIPPSPDWDQVEVAGMIPPSPEWDPQPLPEVEKDGLTERQFLLNQLASLQSKEAEVENRLIETGHGDTVKQIEDQFASSTNYFLPEDPNYGYDRPIPHIEDPIMFAPGDPNSPNYHSSLPPEVPGIEINNSIVDDPIMGALVDPSQDSNHIEQPVNPFTMEGGGGINLPPHVLGASGFFGSAIEAVGHVVQQVQAPEQQQGHHFSSGIIGGVLEAVSHAVHQTQEVQPHSFDSGIEQMAHHVAEEAIHEYKNHDEQGPHSLQHGPPDMMDAPRHEEEQQHHRRHHDDEGGGG